MPKLNLTFIGLGVMGYPMAGHLAAAGHSVCVFNRTASKAERWVAEHGGGRADTPARAAEGADFVFACVGNDDDLRAVTAGDGGAFAGMAQKELNAYTVELTSENFEPLLYQTMLETGAVLDQPLFIGEIDAYPFAICARHCYCVTEGLTQEAVQAIDDEHGDEFDVFYYLNDALDKTTSSTDIEAALTSSAKDKQVRGLVFY